MKLIDFYNRAIHFGRLMDPRKAKSRIKSFPDSAIHYGNLNCQVRKIMVGIDIEVGDLLLADHVRKNHGLDLVVAHHPEGRAFVNLHEVMRLQIDLLVQAGVALPTASKLMEDRMQDVQRRILSQNHTRPVDAARLLEIPFMNLHTPADNHVYHYLNGLFKDRRGSGLILEDLVKILLTIPEYQAAKKFETGPQIIMGNPKRKAGKILLEMTGGTEGSKDIFDKLYQAGVRTLVSMHLSEEHFKKAKDANLNVVIAGHISSDNLGLNLLLDNIEKSAKETFSVVPCSGFIRIKRK